MADDPQILRPYGLQASPRKLVPGAILLGARNEPRRYTPQPLPEGMARVILDDDYYLGPGWSDYTDRSVAWPEGVFDIPAEQRERWQKAQEAYAAMQEEIGALAEERRRT